MIGKINAMIPDQVKDLLSDEKNRMYLMLGVTVAIGALYFVLLINPKISELIKTGTEIRTVNDKIALVDRRFKMLEHRTERLKELRAEIESYAKGLPGEKEVPEFLEELSAIAKTADVSILSITPAPIRSIKEGKSVSYYSEMPISITAKSGYHQLGSFVNDLEEGKRFITIDTLRIKGDSRDPRKHNVRIKMITYVSN